jgi:hypothetical protein
MVIGADVAGRPQTSALANPSFEEDRNRDGVPDGWEPRAAESPAQLAWDDAVAHSGRRSLRISDSFNPGGQRWQETTGRWSALRKIPVNPGQTYTLRAWIKTEGVSSKADARIAFFSDKRWLAENATQSASGTTDWWEVSVTAKAPPEATTMLVYLGLGNSRGSAWFDDVALTTSDGPVPPPEPAIDYEFNDTSGWYPFTFPLDDTNLDSIDLTALLDGPAGKHGFLTVRPDGHFYFQDGARARFFGTNICGAAAAPSREHARTIAARLAKYGVNLLRIHTIDNRNMIIDYSRGDSRHLNAQAFDALDYFFAELKRRGIYVYFDMLDYRVFTAADGVRDAELFEHGWHHSIKGASIFNDRLIALQQEFATNFFKHENPYTKLRYVDDPAMAVVEITNENSVFYFSNTTLTLPSYVEELKQQWNAWLRAQFGTRERLAKAWTNGRGDCALGPEEDPARGTVILPLKYLYQQPQEAPFVGERSPVRVDAMVRFFFEVERRYYEQMRGHLKPIGIRVPITGTNQTFCPASNYADAINDFMSRNNYWCHPDVHAQPFFRFRNLSMLESELPKTNNPVVEVASSSVVGKPILVPEFNFPWPNEFRAEGLPLMTAYGCLQDWDGILLFAYQPKRQTLEWFDSQSDPVRWGEFAAAALMFHRQDVSPARNTVHVAYGERDVFTAGPSHGRAAASPYRYLPLLCKVRNSYFPERYQGDADVVIASNRLPAAALAQARHLLRPPEGASIVDRDTFAQACKDWRLPGFAEGEPSTPKYTSDTGQLSLDPAAGIFTINTPRLQAAVGALGQAGTIELQDVSLRCQTPFAVILVTALEAKPIASARRILVTAVARSENTGQAFTDKKRAVPQHGRAPVLVEPVRSELTIRLRGGASVYPLDETGKRRDPLCATAADGTLRFRTDEAHSPWCEIALQ